jgi:hypothetical protein
MQKKSPTTSRRVSRHRPDADANAAHQRLNLCSHRFNQLYTATKIPYLCNIMACVPTSFPGLNA